MSSIPLPIAELKPALAGLGKIISRQPSLPTLTNVKIERTEEGWIGLTSTDSDRFVTVRLEQPAKGKPVAMLVPYEELAKYTAKHGRDESIAVKTTNSRTVVIVGDRTARNQCATLPVGEFPPVPELKEPPVPLPEPLRRAIREAMRCTSEDPVRAVLHGVFIDVSQPKSHHIVATDGRHLYNSKSWNLRLKKSVIIPKDEFLGWSEFTSDGEWQMKTEGAHVQINSRRWSFITKQIEGDYPNWRQVLPDPKMVQSNIAIDPAAQERLIQTIERMPCDSAEHFTIGMEWKNQRLSLLGRPPEFPTWTRVMIADAVGDGKDVTFFLDRRLLIKALEFGLNTVSIIGPLSPIRLHQGTREMFVMPVGAEAAVPAQEESSAINRGARLPVRAPAPTPQTKAPGRGKGRRQPTSSNIENALTQIRNVFKSGLSSLRQLKLQLQEFERSQKKGEKELQAGLAAKSGAVKAGRKHQA